MDSNINDEHIEITEDVSTEVLRIMRAIKHPDTYQQMNESKKLIFNRISNKIDSDYRIHSDKIDGYKIYLHNRSIVAVVALLLVSVATLTYYLGYQSGKTNLAYTQIETNVPYGSISKITLSDGTKVTLNGGSTLIYPAFFTDKRQVMLLGEGFFDVTKDEKRPFIVHSKNLSAKVLGTRFGFKAYEEDSQTILTLEEGRVSAFPFDNDLKEGILLNPNQQLLINSKDCKVYRRNVNAEEYISWKDDVLIFRDQTLGEIAVILERRFDMKINIQSDTISNERYAARFKYGENIEQILVKLSYKRSWKYVKQNGTIELINRKRS